MPDWEFQTMPFHLPLHTSTKNRAWDIGGVPYTYWINTHEEDFDPEALEMFMMQFGDKTKHNLSTNSPI